MGHLVNVKAVLKTPSHCFLNISFIFELLSPVYGLGFSYLQNSKTKTLQQLLEGYYVYVYMYYGQWDVSLYPIK